MKIKPITFTAILSAYLFILPYDGYAQLTKLDQMSIDLGKSYSMMHENAILVKPMNTKTCKPEDLVNEVDKTNLNVTGRLKTTNLAMINKLFPPADYEFSGIYDSGDFSTFQDRMMNAASISSSFSEFITNATGKNLGEITAETKPKPMTIAEEVVVKDIDVFRNYYDSIKSFEGSWNDIDSENKAEYGTNSEYNVDLSPTKYMGNTDCVSYSKSKLRLKKFDYPNATWELSTEVTVYGCECDDTSDESKVKSGVYEYSSIIEGLFTLKKVTFGSPKKPVITIKSLECCPAKKDEDEPTETSLSEDIGFVDLMQDQTFGFGAGVGFGQDFDETTWCVTGEYLYQLNSDEYTGWYAGAEASHQNTSFNNFSSNRTMAGVKFQYNTSVVPSGETQFVAGIMANFAFGSNENNGFVDDFSGTIFCAYAGTNIRVSEDWSVGLQFPVLIFENFTFKPENGGEFNSDATSLFINKDNPLKIVVRRRF